LKARDIALFDLHARKEQRRPIDHLLNVPGIPPTGIFRKAIYLISLFKKTARYRNSYEVLPLFNVSLPTRERSSAGITLYKPNS